MTDIGQLISGFRVFKATTYESQKDLITHLIAQGQTPSTMVISCVDSRIPPAVMLATNPGELFVVTNIGGLVPKYNTSGVRGIAASMEYAVNQLGVNNIIVLGHAKCDGIKMMMSDDFTADNQNLSEEMKTWLSIASDAREAVKKELRKKKPEIQCAACEHEAIIVSMRNLLTYPYIAKKMSEDQLNIYGWHFNIEDGNIMAFDPDTGFFEPIT